MQKSILGKIKVRLRKVANYVGAPHKVVHWQEVLYKICSYYFKIIDSLLLINSKLNPNYASFLA